MQPIWFEVRDAKAHKLVQEAVIVIACDQENTTPASEKPNTPSPAPDHRSYVGITGKSGYALVHAWTNQTEEMWPLFWDSSKPPPKQFDHATGQTYRVTIITETDRESCSLQMKPGQKHRGALFDVTLKKIGRLHYVDMTPFEFD